MEIIYVALGIVLFILIGLVFLFISTYKKVPQGKAIVRTGVGGSKVALEKGMFVFPVIHKMEIMDISVKKLEVERLGKDGLICKDNMRADIQVAFFVRVNKSIDDIVNVAQTIGCERASNIETLNELFESKFSEALKTVGKQFEFVELYEARREFRDEIINIIGTDLNGYVLDDCAIDYLEQTSIDNLNPNNILDAEGIKKITELTAIQNVKANLVRRDEEKTIRKQDVEAREAILQLDQQLAEKEEAQRREVSNIKAREEAEIQKVAQEERRRSETVRIATDEALSVAEENKDRQIIVAAKNKERTDAVETERVEKDRLLEATERERIVSLAQIEKDKALEIEKKNIQDAIRERVALEKTVVEEQENIKDVEAFKTAERAKKVTLIEAEQEAERNLIDEVKKAEASKQAAEKDAQKFIIEAQAKRDASEKEAEARKIIADAKAKEEATIGLSEAQVIHAKAEAEERKGLVEATIIQKKAEAEAEGNKAKAVAIREQGVAEADVVKEKAIAEAQGIEEKAAAMAKLNDATKEHEEFRLKLEKEQTVELAQINIQKDIAQAQASVLGEAFKTANIDIVGGDNTFFQNVMDKITMGKGIDKMVESSDNLKMLRDSFMKEGSFVDKIKKISDDYNITSDDIKNLSIAALIGKLYTVVRSDAEKSVLDGLLDISKWMGVDGKKLDDWKS